MTLKKTLLLAASALSLPLTHAGTMPVVYPEFNTITYTTSAKTQVKSDKALVQVTVYATALSNDQTTVEDSALQMLKQTIPDIKWRVSNYKQSDSASGALNIILEISARLSQSQLQALNKAIKSANSSSQRISVKVLNYDPTKQMIAQAKQTLMITLYQQVQSYVTRFNKETNSHYKIQYISYNDEKIDPPIQAYDVNGVYG